jgi:hypothetical protein
VTLLAAQSKWWLTFGKRCPNAVISCGCCKCLTHGHRVGDVIATLVATLLCNTEHTNTTCTIMDPISSALLAIMDPITSIIGSSTHTPLRASSCSYYSSLSCSSRLLPLATHCVGHESPRHSAKDACTCLQLWPDGHDASEISVSLQLLNALEVHQRRDTAGHGVVEQRH